MFCDNKPFLSSPDDAIIDSGGLRLIKHLSGESHQQVHLLVKTSSKACKYEKEHEADSFLESKRKKANSPVSLSPDACSPFV